MRDADKTKEQLIEELNGLRREVALLKEEAGRKYGDRDPAMLLEAITESLPNGIVAAELKNGDFTIKYVNRFVESLTGYSREELIGEKPAIFSDGNDGQVINDEILCSVSYNNPWCGEIQLRKKDGRSFRAELRIFPVDTGDGASYWVGIQHDITRRKLTEEALEKSEIRYRALVEQIPAIIYNASVIEDGPTYYISPQVQTVLGFSQEEFMSWPRTWVEQIHPEDRDRVVRELESSRKNNEKFISEYRILSKNGRVLWFHDEATVMRDEAGNPALLQGVMLDITGQKKIEEEYRLFQDSYYKAFNESPCPMVVNAISDGRRLAVNKSFLSLTGFSREEIEGLTYNELYLMNPSEYDKIKDFLLERKSVRDHEITLRIKSGESRTVIVSSVLINTPQGQCAFTALTDITERKKMEADMARLEGLHMVGEMAATIGHEIRNPMTTVRGFLQILGGKKDCAKYREYFDLMIEELDRANKIITEYLSLARNRAVTKEVSNINSVVEMVFPLIMAAGENAGITVKLDLEDVPDLLLDEGEIRQIIFNLVRNGLEAMASGGRLTIKTFMDGQDVVLAVKDQGAGISQENMDKIGTPFFTTKKKGTGLGLAVCYSIAHRHSACISVDTGPEGTTFYVRFKRRPASQDQAN